MCLCYTMQLTIAVGFITIGFVLGVDRPRGVSLEKASFYQGTEFKCFASGKVLPIDHVNDDYCDCEDGSDEPGTSACSNGLFYCENKPYKGSYIMTSRVNDGICDCCDGSDEYDGTIVCENTCEKLFAEIRAQQEAFRKKQEEGYKVKQEYVQQGLRIKEEKRAKMSELTKNKAALVEEKDRLQVAKEEAEIPEKDAKDKHEEAWNAVKQERQRQRDAAAAANAFAQLDMNQDNIVDFPEIMKHLEFDIDSDGTVSEEEAKEYLEENEKTNLEIFTEKIWPNIKEIYKPGVAAGEETETDSPPEQAEVQEPSPPGEEKGEPESAKRPPKQVDQDDIREGGAPSTDEDLDTDDEEEDDDEEKGLYDDEYEEVEEDEEAEYDLKEANKSDKTDETEEDKMPEYDAETKLLIQAADEARRLYDDADKKVRDIENEITDTEKYLQFDFGPNEEFSALKGHCFEFTDREYIYKFCPFDKTSQKPKGGGIETNLGHWGHWHGPEGDKYDAMKYENGQGCWNGPARSCHVNLHCGSENVLTAASEPSRCEYQFDFTTPARCAEPEALPTHPVHEEL